MEPQLSHYTQFFIALTNLVKVQKINSSQKQFLKSNLIRKDPGLMTVIMTNCGPGKEIQLREALNEYVRMNQIGQKRRPKKSKTVTFDLLAQSIQFEPEKVNQQLEQIQKSDEEIKENGPKGPHGLCPTAGLMMEQLRVVLGHHIEKKGSITNNERINLQNLRDQINILLDERIEIESFSPLRPRYSSDRLGEISEESEYENIQEVQNKVLDIYHELKKIFVGNLDTHLLLMQEDISYSNLYSVLKFMVKILVDADEFCFIIRKDKGREIYSTHNDSIVELNSLQDDQIEMEMSLVKQMCVHKINLKTKQYPTIEEIIKAQNYAQTSSIKFVIEKTNAEVFFSFHWLDKDKKNLKRQFINDANKYGFNQEVIAMAQFIVETVIAARVSFFNPLRIADQIQDIGISFIKISRYLLIEAIRKALSTKFKVEKLKREQIFSQEEFKNQQNEQDCVRIEFRDTYPILLQVKGMNLSNEHEAELFSNIIRVKEKYDSFIKLCHEKSAFYKYFLRTTDSLLFDFNKLGQLVFLSRPITNSQKDRYNLSFDPKQILSQKIDYKEIFAKSSILKNIEVNLQNVHHNRRNQYLTTLENPQFEIFFRLVDDNFKGFTVIFHENEDKRMQYELKALKIENGSLEADIQKSIQKQLNKHQTIKFLTQLGQTTDVKNSMISLFISENELDQLISQKISKPKSQHQSPAREENDNNQLQKKKFKFDKKLTCDLVDTIHFFELESDPEFDQWNYNIFQSQNKSRCVYAILKRSGFIEKYSMPLEQLAQFLTTLQYKYNKRGNPFHNYEHGIAVMQSCYMFCRVEKVVDLTTELIRMATIVSGLCHDVSHTARTNLFMINSRSKLATRYHDQSPLEQHHAATTIFLLQQPKLNFVCNLAKDEYNKFRRVLIDNILYTDIKVHFNLLKDFESRIKDQDKQFGTSDDDTKLLTGMILHTADFNGGAKVFELSRVWSERVNVEFSAQYEEEGQLGIPQTPFLKDLDKLHILAKSEMGFFKVIVRPLWATLNQFLDGAIQESVDNLDDTIISWEKIYHQNI